MINNNFLSSVRTILITITVLMFGLLGLATTVEAATLSLSPSTGVYTTGSTFTVNVLVNTTGQNVNAADGTLSFNPRELSVVSVTRASSIFNLWTAEPTFSNSAGTVSFSGGSPTGYTGSAGRVMSVTFRSLTSGTARVSMTGGSVLAADGRGTNVLTSMGGGTYTLTAQETQPTPEVVIEYVPPANTPAAPTVRSDSHPDPEAWHTNTTATLSWAVPADVTQVRTLLNSNPTSVPSRVYETPIRDITLEDLEQGVQYFHIQFRNEDGWGRVAHYRLAVDSQKPESFTVALAEEADLTSPVQTLTLTAEDATSPVRRYLVQIDGAEPYEFIDTTGSSTLTLPTLEPGYHTVIIEAFDAAGNSLIGSISFTILAFDRPEFVDYPEILNEGVVPVIKGQTRPRSVVEVSIMTGTAEPQVYSVTADENGIFTFIPDTALTQGVYRLSAIAIDQYGAQSERSDEISIVVQLPGYMAIGSFVVSILSVFVPLLALLVVLVLGGWYVLMRWRRLRRGVTRESKEALAILQREFTTLRQTLTTESVALAASRKANKLTKAESDLIATLTAALDRAEDTVEKEIEDVTELVTNIQK